MPKNPHQLAIIIVEFDSPDDTVLCLKSIETHLQSRCKLYIYNNSTKRHNRLQVKLSSLSLPFEYIWNDGNLGFAKACNMGLEKAKSDGFQYAMLLNNDTLLVNDSPLSAIDVFRINQDIGILGLVNYHSSNPSVVWQAGKNLRRSKLGFYSVKDSPDSDITFCDYVPGSSLVVRLSILDNVGLLNEDYFAYYEEIDYCFRVRNAGMKVAYINNSRILHKVGASSDSVLKTYLKSRNKLYFYRTIMTSRFKYFLVVCLLLLMDFLKSLIRPGFLGNTKYMCFGISDYRRNRMKFERFSK